MKFLSDDIYYLSQTGCCAQGIPFDLSTQVGFIMK